MLGTILLRSPSPPIEDTGSGGGDGDGDGDNWPRDALLPNRQAARPVEYRKSPIDNIVAWSRGTGECKSQNITRPVAKELEPKLDGRRRTWVHYRYHCENDLEDECLRILRSETDKNRGQRERDISGIFPNIAPSALVDSHTGPYCCCLTVDL
ncbi:hypothetical protein P167DRAFT_546946 [Morchella conica CCBAS932]|uniref:Uncharacterized protein n=1 Tax=Morchella conica CCBAS932 TaxID=1392247 RepID=A0A3N4KJV5_9PEZI|nr:hypothetical protein P167DRAFT_546946 [Morchella conica CCBAS932]